MFGHLSRVFGVKALQSIHALCGEGRNDFIAMIYTWMGHDGQSARLMNQSNGVESGNFEFGHPSGAALFQKALEGGLHART